MKTSTSDTRPSDHEGARVDVALLTGGQDGHYAFGLATALASRHVYLDVVGSEEVDCPEFHTTRGLNFLSLRSKQSRDAGVWRKGARVLAYYARLLRYAASAKPKVFHILWNNKFQFFDRTLLMLYYKLLGKKVVITAHNVNAGKRDSRDSLVNRLTLRVQYRLADHVFVHTDKMKWELIADFGVREHAITVIPYGINNAIPTTTLSPSQAKRRLAITGGRKTILFFGAIAPYKGLDLLVAAFQQIIARDPNYVLVIAGSPKKGSEQYLEEIRRTISTTTNPDQLIQQIEFIPDSEAELYFKAADVIVLPYVHIFQSGILFWALSFGLPVVATDVGCFRDDVIEGKTGLLCRPGDATHLAATIERYFDSDLFKHLDSRRRDIRDFAWQRHAWDVVGDMTRAVYVQLLGPHFQPSHDPTLEPSATEQQCVLSSSTGSIDK